jgi:hypothetical protein
VLLELLATSSRLGYPLGAGIVWRL